jgi:hypothetical protein
MPQIAPITINDGAGTPVPRTFSPIGRDDQGVFWWEETSPTPTSQLAAAKISYKQSRGMRSSKQLNAVSKAVYALWYPTPETLATNDNGLLPPPTLAYEEKARIEFDLAERSTPQERKHTRVLAMNLLGHAMAVANIDTLQPSYS